MEDGPIEIIVSGKPEPVTLEVGDVLIRHPWALHRGTPNLTDAPRALLTIRYIIWLIVGK